MKRTFHLFLFTFILFAVFLVTSCDAKVTGFKITPSTYDYKYVARGNTVPYYFRLRNDSGAMIVVSNLTFVGYASDDYKITMGGETPIFVKDGTSHLLTIEFTPMDEGPRAARLIINHNGAGAINEINLTGQGLNVPRISLSDPSYDFGIVYANLTATHDFIIENTGTSKLVLNKLDISGASARLFDLPGGVTTPLIIDVGASENVTMSFTPTTDGIFPVTFSIYHNAVNEDNPLEIEIDAEGVTYAPEMKIDRATTTPWDFGKTGTGYPVEEKITIESDGIDPLMLATVHVVNGTVFSIKDMVDGQGNPVSLPKSFPKGEKVTFTVKFDPLGTANYQDYLRIEHDAINEARPLDIELLAEGILVVTKNYSYTGYTEQFTVPAGITSLRIMASGAGGGGQNGGKGGYIEGVVTVTPGETYTIVVGGKGKEQTYSRCSFGGGGYTGLLDSAGNHVITAGGAGGCGNYGNYPAGGDGGGGDGTSSICGDEGKGGINGSAPSGGIGGLGFTQGGSGTAIGGGKGGDGGSNWGGGGGGGGWGTAGGKGGTQYSASGYGGDGGFGGGGGGAGGGFGSTYARYATGGGGGGGYAGGGGGECKSSCSSSSYGGGGGGGGSNYADSAKVNIIKDEKGTGAGTKTDGSLIIIY